MLRKSPAFSAASSTCVSSRAPHTWEDFLSFSIFLKKKKKDTSSSLSAEEIQRRFSHKLKMNIKRCPPGPCSIAQTCEETQREDSGQLMLSPSSPTAVDLWAWKKESCCTSCELRGSTYWLAGAKQWVQSGRMWKIIIKSIKREKKMLQTKFVLSLWVTLRS